MLGLPSSRPLLNGIQTCNQVMQASYCPKERIVLGASQASDYGNSTAFFVTPVRTKIHIEAGFLFLKKIPTFSKIPKYRCRQLKCSCSLAQKFHQLMTFWRNVTREQNISNPL